MFLLADIIGITALALLLYANSVTFLSALDMESTNLHVAFVENSFTGAAYRDGGFYDFYKKHGDEIKMGKSITSSRKETLLSTRSTATTWTRSRCSGLKTSWGERLRSGR